MIQYMPLFRACSNSRSLAQLHAHLIINGLHKDPLPSTKLIESYAQMGSLKTSRLVFYTYPNPDPFMWGVIIKCHVWYNCFQDSIFLYHNMLYHSTQTNSFIYPSVLRAISAIGDVGIGQKVHGRILKCGFESDPIVETALLSMYGELGWTVCARKMFDEMSVRDVISWSSIVSSYVRNGKVREGLEVFGNLVKEEVEIDSVTLLSAVEACGELGVWRLGKSVHGYILRKGIQGDGSLTNSLVAMYGKCGDMCSAESLFDNAVDKSTYTWTATISCYNQNGSYQDALALFVKMHESDVEYNEVTLMAVLCSCARLGWLKEGKSIHGFILRNGLDCDDDLLGSALVDLYANCGKVSDCHKVFDTSQDTRIVSWNMLISGYVQEGLSENALTLFVDMLRKGILPDSYTLASVLSASGDIGFSEFGCQIHSHVIRTGFSTEEFVQNSMIDMYSKCGLVDCAFLIFKDTQERSVVTWNSVMCGLSRNGFSREAISLFDEIYSNSSKMDEVTFLAAIQACSTIGWLEKGKWLHHKLIIFGVRHDMYVDTALTDMYAKCGDLLMARRVFDNMSGRSIISWSAMIGGYGTHGQIDAAISLFHEMVNSGIKPNDIILTNILSACSHTGYLDEGKYFFNLMINLNIEPKPEHFACLVDLLSRAGDIDKAYEVITSMPFPADVSIWGALVNGCRIHKRMDIIKMIQQRLENMQTDDTGYYTLLSNIYAEGGEWNESRVVRSKMHSLGLRKVDGYSMIEVEKRIHIGKANDTYSFSNREISSL
ncbi:putative pentatricopeptide repeat-containing protein At1g69350, mitochondrial [Nicotiana tabacum]|uniref:Pentatricopeptide repeat-containing protein At1g69350, mitochondrial n=1 Tax=Nicotiana tabacum TaxID=4097 RepID=A0A1S3Z8M0_TOBAC|nr:putative pentatricopeptide repeat-containing protein At1g69350, mitochondrial [Nicotiana tomentosiformis]